MIISRTCPFCGKTTDIMVDPDDFYRYEFGALAQDAFTDLSATEREVIISGICPKCQESVFGVGE